MPAAVEAALPLVEKYTSRVPRYTSYPTAVEFKPAFTARDWMTTLEGDVRAHGPDTSLYVHIPFCKTLCFFCACAREGGRNRERVAPYLDSLTREILSYSPIAPDLQISQLHFGGGSPNYLTPEELSALVGSLRSHCPNWRDDAELSVELDPRETSIEQVDTLHSLGFSRISFGVQDLHPEVQRAIHRSQSREATERLVHHSRTLGINEINFDLIYGLPHQTLDSWRQTLEQVIEIRPERLAVYGYAHVDWRAKGQLAFNDIPTLPSPQERIQLFALAHSMLTDAGYFYLGLDHFALAEDSLTRAFHNGTMRRNFMGYSTQAKTRVIGLGASAISSTQSSFSQNAVGVDDYNQSMSTQGNAVVRGIVLTEDDQVRRDIIEDIMCRGHLSLASYASRLAEAPEALFPNLSQNLKGLERDGLIITTASGFDVTAVGRFFLRNIAVLFDGYAHKYAGATKVFSSSL